MNEKRLIGQKLLRCGFTTGSCAAASAKAAAKLLLLEEKSLKASILLPGGKALTLDIADHVKHSDLARCAVKKDSGDDPDITNGVLVYATVRRTPSGITITGGPGIGKVTLPGLERPVGDWAINTAPRKLIEQELLSVLSDSGEVCGLICELSIPGGEEIAKKTFNPRLGIVGGLSILGTSGIVEPMSDNALIDSLRLELSQLYEAGERRVLLTPGNYGEDFCRSTLSYTPPIIKCSNFIGDAIDAAAQLGFKEILMVGHIGKFSKLGLGIMNTHSKNGDGRMECLSSCALEVGASGNEARTLLSCVSCDAALELLKKYGLFSDTMLLLGRRIEYNLSRRVPTDIAIDFICFTNAPAPTILCASKPLDKLSSNWR